MNNKSSQIEKFTGRIEEVSETFKRKYNLKDEDKIILPVKIIDKETGQIFYINEYRKIIFEGCLSKILHIYKYLDGYIIEYREVYGYTGNIENGVVMFGFITAEDGNKFKEVEDYE